VAGDDRVGVHLLDRHSAVLDAVARDDLQAVEQGRGVAAAVRLDEAHYDVSAAFVAAVRLLEHLVGLAHAGRHAHVDAHPSALRLLIALHSGEHLIAGGSAVIGRFDRHLSSHKDPGSAPGRAPRPRR